MIRLCFLTLSFFVLIVVQISFVQSLPYPLSSIPFIFIFSIFLFQYVSMRPAIWWILFEGVFFDFLGVGVGPLETVAYGLAALVVLLCERHLFSNRSYYGLAATTLLGLLTLASAEIAVSVIANFFSPAAFNPQSMLSVRLMGMLLSIPVLLALFPMADHVRRIMKLLTLS